MEFIDLSRYFAVNSPNILPFKELRQMTPVWLTHDLKIVDEPDNIEYARSLANQGITVVPIRRRPPFPKYLNRIDFPRRILFEMTSRCNFATCRMCPYQYLKRPQMDMDGKLYRKIIDEIDHYGIEGLWLYHLGESLMHPEFRENVKHISTKSNLGVIWLSTNGEYFTEENIRFVLDSNIDFINFSAHATTKETYQTVAPGDFDLVQHNLEKFFEMKGAAKAYRKPFLHLQMIEQETTKHEVDAFIQKYYQRADIVSVNMLEYVSLPNNNFGFKQRDRKPLTTCTRVTRNDCFICSNGHVTLCDVAYNGEIDLGDVNSQSLYEIWNGKERNKVLQLNEQGMMGKMEFCQKCTDYDI